MSKKINNDKKDGVKFSSLMSFKEKVAKIVHHEAFHFIVGLFSLLFAAYLLWAFLSFYFTGGADQSLMDNIDTSQLIDIDNGVKNAAGARGAQIAQGAMNNCFGLSSFFFILFFAVVGLRLMKVHRFELKKWFIHCTFLLLWSSVFLGYLSFLVDILPFAFLGGKYGSTTAAWLVSQIGELGLVLLLLGLGICYLIYVSSRTIYYIRDILTLRALRVRMAAARRHKGEPMDAPEYQEDEEEFVEKSSPEQNEEELESATIILHQTDGEPDDAQQSDNNPVFTNDPPSSDDQEFVVEVPQRDEAEPLVAGTETAGQVEKVPEFEVEAGQADELTDAPLEPYNPTKDLEYYKFPTLDLMKHFDNEDPSIDMEEQKANKDRIINTLHSFGIEISTIKATVGPTVTLYEITPEQGVRIAKIRGLEDDIALSLAADGIRIIAPIPGKGTIGIEVPNKNPKIVSGQSVIGSRKFQESKYELPVVLGKTITNEVFMFDLCKMPHVLVAGATGQGKSVGLNAIITSLLYKKHPAELKFVLVDPKKVEFSIYSVIENHFLAELPDESEPIITDVKKVVRTLNSVCVEMDTRYDLLKMARARNVKEYNAKFIARELNPEHGHKYMPYIVVVIDEFGDLIMTAGKEVELPIARIAQLARAVGIHMIIATQRPTTNIITGTIKANFPARIAFRVSSMTDSRTILDRPGANRLIGKGDMLFLQGADPVRVQCAFIDTPEVENITKYIARQQSYPTPFYLPEYEGDDEGAESADVDMGRLDALFEDAARLIVIHQQGSTSLIQRKFAIGYARAGRIMDQLEAAGIVGPSQGSKPREVLCVDETDLEMRLNNLK